MSKTAKTDKRNISSGNRSEGQQVLRVWNYVMNIIYHNPGKIVRVPSSRQLAQTLQMSRSTVNLTYDKLIKAEYLISRQGSGTYTNPRRSFFPARQAAPLVGISFFEGDAFFYNSSGWRIIATLGEGLSERGYNVKLHQNGIAGKIQTDRLLQFSCMDALVCYNGRPEELEEIAKQIPVVALGQHSYAHLPNVRLKFDAAAIGIIKLIAAENIQECLLLRTEAADDELHILGETLLRLDKTLRIRELNIKDTGFPEELEKYLMQKQRILLFHYNQYSDFAESCRSRYTDTVVTLSYNHPPRHNRYSGYSLDYPWTTVADQTAELLRENMADRSKCRELICEAELCSWRPAPLHHTPEPVKISTAQTEFCVEGLTGSIWTLQSRWLELEKDLYELHFELNAPKPSEYPELTIRWELPLLDTINCWTTAHSGAPELQPDWGRKRCFSIADEIPELIFHNRAGLCTAAAAYSDAMRSVEFNGGIFEANCSLRFALGLFRKKEAPAQNYKGILRLDLRRNFFADTVRSFTRWYAAFPEYTALPVPESAYEPLYSTWYSYHHDVHADTIRQECEEAARLGMKTVIVDSGWETDDNTLGPIACGDWEISSNRFPDPATHVRAVKSLGFKYMMWFAVPFIGRNSRRFEEFKDRYLFLTRDAGVLDPRFPEVRRYLIDCCRRLIHDYHLDGLKLDFINTFTECDKDPALTYGRGDRDISTIPEAIDRLMMSITQALNEIRQDILIEFRQCYIGPAIRKYGNMFRAADCPADPAGNRRRTINLRLSSDTTAVHSDMLEWRSDYDVNNAALQLLGVMFSVPQISVRLAELPDDHRKMLKFLLDFLVRHRKLLLKSDLHPCHPEQNYPIVYAATKSERIATVYSGGQWVRFPVGSSAGNTYIVNASETDEIVADLPFTIKSALLRNCLGEELPFAIPQPGFSRIAMPSGSILKLCGTQPDLG